MVGEMLQNNPYHHKVEFIFFLLSGQKFCIIRNTLRNKVVYLTILDFSASRRALKVLQRGWAEITSYHKKEPLLAIVSIREVIN